VHLFDIVDVNIFFYKLVKVQKFGLGVRIKPKWLHFGIEEVVFAIFLLKHYNFPVTK